MFLFINHARKLRKWSKLHEILYLIYKCFVLNFQKKKSSGNFKEVGFLHLQNVYDETLSFWTSSFVTNDSSFILICC